MVQVRAAGDGKAAVRRSAALRSKEKIPELPLFADAPRCQLGVQPVLPAGGEDGSAVFPAAEVPGNAVADMPGLRIAGLPFQEKGVVFGPVEGVPGVVHEFALGVVENHFVPHKSSPS